MRSFLALISKLISILYKIVYILHNIGSNKYTYEFNITITKWQSKVTEINHMPTDMEAYAVICASEIYYHIGIQSL